MYQAIINNIAEVLSSGAGAVAVGAAQKLGSDIMDGLLAHFRKLGRNPTEIEAKEFVENFLQMNGINAKADSVIEVMAKQGIICLESSKLHGNAGLTFGANQGLAKISGPSNLSTARSAISMGAGATIQAVGNAQVVLDGDGSIKFCT